MMINNLDHIPNMLLERNSTPDPLIGISCGYYDIHVKVIDVCTLRVYTDGNGGSALLQDRTGYDTHNGDGHLAYFLWDT
jgi:hypothetical protein